MSTELEATANAPEFVQMLNEYMDTCRDLKEAMHEIKAVRERKAELRLAIHEYMATNSMRDGIVAHGYRFFIKTRQARKKLKTTELLEVLKQELGDGVESVVARANEQQPVQEVEQLMQRKLRRKEDERDDE